MSHTTTPPNLSPSQYVFFTFICCEPGFSKSSAVFYDEDCSPKSRLHFASWFNLAATLSGFTTFKSLPCLCIVTWFYHRSYIRLHGNRPSYATLPCGMRTPRGGLIWGLSISEVCVVEIDVTLVAC